MRSFVKYLCPLAVVALLSCEGEFIEADLAISLVYPLENQTCEDARLTQNSVEVPFRWTAQGDFDSFVLIVNDVERTEQLRFDEANKQYEVLVPLAYQRQYSWRVIGKQSIDFQSDSWSFSTPATFENINFAPYPVVFDEPITSPGQVILNWTAEDPDGPAETDELRFEVYLDEADPPTTLRNTDNPKSTSITVQNLERKTYYVRVVAIDLEGNSSTNSISFDGE